MVDKEKPLEWTASSYKVLMALLPDVHRRFGYALPLAQMGDQDDAAKVLKGFRRGRRAAHPGLIGDGRGWHPLD